MTDYRESHPHAGKPRAAVQGVPLPRLTFDLATDRGPISIEVPPELLRHCEVVSRVTFRVDDRSVFSLPMFTHGVPLHSICSLTGDVDVWADPGFPET